GWQEMTRKVAQVYYSLPVADRAKACIVTSNYGEAGAIEYYGEKYHLPMPPVSGNLQYYIWGPGRFSGEVVILVGFSYDDVKVSYQDVRKGLILTNPYMMPHERENPIYVGRKPFRRFQEIKPWFKWFD
ncbi:MAG TPA: glycosyltransferase, partial [Bacillota bacterium]|nr:glycosyltransferase [Bacillota bacterium]